MQHTAAPKIAPRVDLPELDATVLLKIREKAAGLDHGEIHLIFVASRVTTIVRVEAERLVKS